MTLVGPTVGIYLIAACLRFTVFRSLPAMLGWLVAPLLSFLIATVAFYVLTSEVPFALLWLFWLGMIVTGIALAISLAIAGAHLFHRTERADV